MKNTTKLIAIAATLVVGFILQQPVRANTDAPAPASTGNNGAGAAPAASATVSANAAVVPASNMPTNDPPASAAESDTNAPATPDQTASAASPETNAPVTAPIRLQDVPLTTAIESLAQAAGINYLLDPKIGYGQPDQNGQIKPEPTLSVHWENVTARQALLALLDNYGLQLVEDPKTQIARITLKDVSAPPPLLTRVIQLKYASTSNMQSAVESTLTDKRSRVVPDVRTSQLVLVATEAEQNQIDILVGQLDKPTRQVLIEAKLIELSSNPSTSKGIDWSSTLSAQNFSFGNGVLNAVTPSASSTTIPGTTTTTGGGTGSGGAQQPSTTVTPSYTTSTILNSEPQSSLFPGGLSLNTLSGMTPNIGFLSADGVKAVLSFLNESAEAQVVSTPRVVTLDNETATIEVTRAFPVINVTASTANTSGGSSITYSNIGTILQVTPRITANDYIWLKVIPDVSSFFEAESTTIGGATYTADIFDQRHLETQVLIPTAHTLVMGGLLQDNPNAQYTKVPFLGDIPVLGLAFRHEQKSLVKDNLLIFITPTIVKDEDFQASTSDFLKSVPRTMKDPMDPHTMWDSAEPRGDWSNPLEMSNNPTNTTQSSSTVISPEL